MIEYDVGFNDEGKVAALKIRGYFLCGAEMNLGFNDMVILASGVDQVCAARLGCAGVGCGGTLGSTGQLLCQPVEVVVPCPACSLETSSEADMRICTL